MSETQLQSISDNFGSNGKLTKEQADYFIKLTMDGVEEYGRWLKELKESDPLGYAKYMKQCRRDEAKQHLGPVKNKGIQVKDIPTRPILELLNKNPDTWHNPWNETDGIMPSVLPAFPQEVIDNFDSNTRSTERIVIAKMKQLVRAGLVDGNANFRNRGDFTITNKGMEWLKNNV
jgi:hypothetical protein